MAMFPVPATTASLNVKTMLELIAIVVEPSNGDEVDSVGGDSSCPDAEVVKVKVVVSVIPTKKLLLESLTAVGEI